MKGWTQFPKGTQAGDRSRVILSQEVLCVLTSPTSTALDRWQFHGGRAPKILPQELRVMEIPLSTLWVSGLGQLSWPGPPVLALSWQRQKLPTSYRLLKLLFFISTIWNLSISLPGLSPVSSQQLYKRSGRNTSCQGITTSRCFLFLSEIVTWQKSQPHWTSSWKWWLFPWSHWDFGSPYTPGYLIIPFRTGSCTATILYSSNSRQSRQKLKPEPALLMDDLTLHFPAPGHFNQCRSN